MGEDTKQRDVMVTSDETPIESKNPAAPSATDQADAEPRLVRRIAPWAMAVIALILVSMLALLFADTHSTDAAVRPTPTATPAPTITPAPTATPQPIDGFQFYRDQNSMVIARCVACSVGFVVREDHAANVRRLMKVHQLHVCKPSLRGVVAGYLK